MEHTADSHSSSYQTLADIIQKRTGVSPLDCYQCGRCAAGCFQNVAGEMDQSPTRILRLIQLEAAFAHEPDRAAEFANKSLSSDTCWLCAGCNACTTRCPQGVDIAGTMDALRQESVKRNLASKSKRAKDIQALHEVFLKSAVNHGRVHELFMVMGYKLKTGHLFADAMLGQSMFLKGKLAILPGKTPEHEAVKKTVEELKKESH